MSEATPGPDAAGSSDEGAAAGSGTNSGTSGTGGGPSRRTFLKVGAVAAGGLIVAFSVPGVRETVTQLGRDIPPFVPNAWLRVGADGTVLVIVDELEMGQGVLTAMPMLIAEELAVPWDRIRVQHGPLDPGSWPRRIVTGGSTSVRTGWERIRMAGATAREMLKAAAAAEWEVPVAELDVRDGEVVHPATGRSRSYGRLVEAAAEMDPPDEDAIVLKRPDEFQVLGTPLPRKDTAPKVNGSQVYSMDVRRPGMLFAVVARPPVLGGRLRRFDAADARAVPGVRDVVEIERGVAVVADDTWAAIQGRDALQLEWDHGTLGGVSETEFWREMERKARGPALVARSEGDVAGALARAPSTRRLEAVYRVPYLAHACMEPMNCTAEVRPDGVEVWAPTQHATGTQEEAARVAGVDVTDVTVHSIPMGGGFGRRSQVDFVTEAVAVAKAVGAPVKVVYTREDDTRAGFYRPAAYHRLSAALGADGLPTAWRHRVVAPGILAQHYGLPDDRVDGDAVAGAENLPYTVPNLQVDWARLDRDEIPVWWWRSVGHSHNAFATECFLDELATRAGADPVEYRRRLLRGHPRHLGVLERAAREAGWGSPLPDGRGRGVAVHGGFGSYVAWVAEVSVVDGQIRVHRAVGAVDAGWTVNPDIIEAQMQGGMAYGLTAALHGRLTLDAGRIVEGNFDRYPMLRIDQMPRVEVHIIDSTADPGGMGEPPTPPIAPAVANAVAAVTGRRLRQMPLRPESATA